MSRRAVSERAARVPRATRLVVGALLVAAVLLALPRGRVVAEGAALRALEHLPADERCGQTLGRLAAVAQGAGLPDDACLGELASGPLSVAVLSRIVRDADRPVPARATALAALLRADAGPPGLAAALLAAPATSPHMRVAASAAARTDADAVGWAERDAAAALHGLHDRGIARLFALGEPDTTLRAAAMLGAYGPGEPAHEVLADVYAGLGVARADLETAVERHARGQLPVGLPTAWWPAFWRHGCEEGRAPLLKALLVLEARRRGEGEAEQPPPPVPGADAALDVLYAEDGAAGDHVREELHAVARWIGAVSEARRGARLVAATLHPDAEAPDAAAASREMGDPHAVLQRAAGSPGAVALVTADLALASRVPLTAWVTGRGVALQVGGRLLAVEPCAPARPADGPGADWRDVPLGGIDALALVEGAVQALRRGDVAGARARLDAARAAWSDAPGVAAVDAAILAREGPPSPPVEVAADPPSQMRSRRARRTVPPTPAPPALVQAGPLLGVAAGEALLVSRPAYPPPGRAGRGWAPAPDTRAASRARVAAHTAGILALTTTPADRLSAAWWAASAGHEDLARALLAAAGDPTAVAPEHVPLWRAVARAVGEPLPEMPAAPPTAAGFVAPCPAAFRPDPPAWAFTGAPPSRAPADG